MARADCDAAGAVLQSFQCQIYDVILDLSEEQ